MEGERTPFPFFTTTTTIMLCRLVSLTLSDVSRFTFQVSTRAHHMQPNVLRLSKVTAAKAISLITGWSAVVYRIISCWHADFIGNRVK